MPPRRERKEAIVTTHPQAATQEGQGRKGADSGATVLVVEDEHRLRMVTVSQLEALGYRVLEAADGPAALDVLERHPEVEVLYSDLVMPGRLSGLDLARRVMELYPAVRIVLTTGYADLTGEADLDLRVLYKPYRRADLQRVLRDALDAPPRSSRSEAPRRPD